MKRKNLVYVSVALVALLGTTACDPKTSTPISSPNNSTTTPPVTSSISTPVSSSTPKPSSSTPKPSSTSPDVFVDPTPRPVAESLPDGTVTRTYKSDFDQMIDDFSAATAKGTLSTSGAVYQSKPYLKVPLHSKWDENVTNDNDKLFPGSADGAIYKVASGTYDFLQMDGIGIKVRLVKGSDPLSLDNLVFGLRGDDQHQVYPIKFSAAKDIDGEALPALTENSQDLIISLKETITDDSEVYKNLDGTASSLKLSDAMIGFHIYATGNCKSDIEIEEIFGYTGATRTVIDDFNRTNVGAGDANVYWRDSKGTIEIRNVALENGSYSVSDPTATDMKNIAVAIKGDTSQTTVTAITATGEGVSKKWSELKNPANVALPAALKDNYANYVINLENSGLGTGVIGLKINSVTPVKVSNIFLTDLVDILAQDYPAINVDSIKVFDNFNRAQTVFTDNWDTSATDPLVTGANLNGCVSYTFGTRPDIEIKDGHLNFKATDVYSDLVEGSKTARDGAQYLVFAMKTAEGGSFNEFRIKGTNAGDAVYFNDWYAAPGTKSKDTPYQHDGYSWYVIDLELSGLGAMTDQLIMYYTGSKDLLIDEVFFADAQKTNDLEEAKAKINEEDLVLDFQTGGYTSVYGGYVGEPADQVYALTLKGDGETTLEAVRLQLNMASGGDSIWFKDGAIKDIDGEVIDATAVLPTEPTTIYIDLAASGFKLVAPVGSVQNGNVTIHAGAFDDKKGLITITKIATYNYKAGYSEKMLETPKVIQHNNETGGYQYVAGSAGKIGGAKYLTLTVTGDLQTMRLGDGLGKEWYAKDGVIKLKDGTVLDVSAPFSAETVIVIDLVATGFTNGSEIHVHNGMTTNENAVTYKSIVLTADNTPYQSVIDTYYPATPAA